MVCKGVSASSKRWDEAIEDAKDTIAKCERKIESMKAAIQAFKRSRDEGAIYPGLQGASHSDGQQHSV
jgi:prefoldin subunit 5